MKKNISQANRYCAVALPLLFTMPLFFASYSAKLPQDDIKTDSPLLSVRKVTATIDTKQTFQTIDNFAASDAWACQFVGNWPDEKRNAIADLLFSADTSASGQPKGIGLSLWRFNIGAGSAQKGTQSGIKNAWRRAESFLEEDGSYNWQQQAGQV